MQSAHSGFKPVQKRPLAPDNHHTAAAAEPPAKKRRFTLSSQTSGEKTPNPFEQITRDKVLQQLSNSSFHLDLSDFSAPELIMLPAEALGNACAKVSSLTLPGKLWKLPAFCRHMPALRELHLPNYFGENLDLKDLPQLARVEGSAGVLLCSVHADAHTELDISVPQRFYKVRVHRYIDGQPCRTHALPGHAYTHIAPGAYAPDNTQFNGIACFPDNGQPIVCRHIAAHVDKAWPTIKQMGKLSSPGFAGIAIHADLASTIDSGIEYRFASDFMGSKCYAFVDDTGFGTFASGQLDLLMQQAKLHHVSKAWASYYLNSTNHVMNMLLSAKATTPPVYSATLVDPNFFLARRRIEANSLTAIQHVTRGWTLSALIRPDQLRLYTDPTRSPLLYVFNAQHRAALERPSIHTHMSQAQLLNGELYFAMMSMKLHEPLAETLRTLLDTYQQASITGAQVFHALAARNMGNSNGLSHAIKIGDSESVRLFTQAVERLATTLTPAHLLNYGPDTLPDQWCEALLTTTQSWTEIVLAQESAPSASLAILVDAVRRLFESHCLSAEACVSFLRRGVAEGYPTWNAIDAAIAKNDTALLPAFGKLVASLYLSGSVSRTECEQLVKDNTLLSSWLPGQPISDISEGN